MYGVCEEETSGTVIRVKDGIGKDHCLIVRLCMRSKEEACCKDEITRDVFQKIAMENTQSVTYLKIRIVPR